VHAAWVTTPAVLEGRPRRSPLGYWSGPGDADFKQGLFTGDAEQVRAGAQAFVDAEIDEVIVQIKNVHDLTAIGQAGQALAGLRARQA
jgi:hypothetical protein